MTREHNLTIDTAAATRGQRVNNKDSFSDSEDTIYDDEDDLTSSPSIPDEEINFDLVYALHNFDATIDGQVGVERNNPLILLDDSNGYWWLVKVIKNEEVGYIPAENIEVKITT